ncbi:hypothetical protein Leryth_026189 [Lithospermum erythrorhizon]|nr:hypothetical protein Leryth_026189 [Lithospermum erythrorhizon]
MEWWEKMAFPVKRAWISVSSRVKARKNGAGLLKLQDDIQTCGYQDVQVMWEMLSRTESESKSPQTKRKQRSLWRIFAWTNQSTTSSFSAEYAQ